MPFNPDEFLAQKQTEVPVAGSAKAFDPDAFLATTGNSQLPNNGLPEAASLSEPLPNSNPPTRLSSAVLGFEQGATYNAAKKAAEAIDPANAKAFDESQAANPFTFALGQLGGAIVSPSPIGKLKAIKDAGALAKAAFNATDFASRIGLSSFFGSNDPSLQGKLEAVKDAYKDPLTLGLGAVATLAPSLPDVIRKGSKLLVKDGNKAVALGKGMENALASEEGQVAVSRAVGQFENNTIQAAQKGLQNLGTSMDNVAVQNQGVTADIKSALSKTFDFFKKQKPEELLDKDRVALSKLQNFVTAGDDALAQAGGAENASFESIYKLKKDLGRLIFDPQSGAGRTFNNADPAIKKQAVQLYSQLSDTLGKADKTQTFKELSKAFTGVYKTMDAADDLGNSLSQMSNKLNVGGVNKRDAIVDAYKSIPPQYVAALPELGNQILNKMDNTITAYNVASKIAGQSPQKADVLSQFMAKIPLLSEGSRLNMLNQLGRTAVKKPTTGALGMGMDAVSTMTTPGALTGVKEGVDSIKNPSALREIQ